MTFAGELKGKSALVTGGTGGMGQAIVAVLSAAGANVMVADLDEARFVAPEASVAGAGPVAFRSTDVSDEESVRGLVGHTVSEFGGLDIAVNAAAIAPVAGMLVETSVEDFDRITAVNLRSVFLCLKYEIEHMLTAGGSIINVASTSGLRPQLAQAAYAASKHGVIGLTKAAAIEYSAQGVRVNAVVPGAIDTPMLRSTIETRGLDEQEVADRLSVVGRFGTSEEIAQAVLWLASDRSSYTYGHCLAVDGGFLAR